MMKLGTLLFLIIILFGTIACTAEGSKDSDKPSATGQIETATMEDKLMPAKPQESASTIEADPIPSVTTENAVATDGPVPTSTLAMAPLPVIGPAPGWNNKIWINTESPQPLEELKGKVVLLEFWTFG
jgi:hypothetical protein